MKLTLKRLREATNDGTSGWLFLADQAKWATLERTSRRIPAGVYKVVLTESTRARAGNLWTPWSDARLPLVLNVPGRDGIRFHAGNKPTDAIGCIMLGMDGLNGELVHSRAAMVSFMEAVTFPLDLEVQDGV